MSQPEVFLLRDELEAIIKAQTRTIATLTAERDELLKALTEMQRLDPYNQLEVAGEELAHLEAERDALRTALEEIRDADHLAGHWARERAREALEAGK